MARRRSRVATTALVLTLMVAAALPAACGSGDDDEARVEPTTTATVDAGAAPFCTAFGALLAGPLAEGGFDPARPEELRAAVGLTAQVVDALRSSAPPEVAGAAAALADAYTAAFAVLERYGYDLARVDAEATPAERGTLDSFGRPPAGPGVVDPYEEVESFVVARCAPGLDLPPDLTATTNP